MALITTGACIVCDDYPSKLPCQPGLYDDKFIPGLRKLADSVHQYGAKMLMRLWHIVYDVVDSYQALLDKVMR